LRNPRTGFPSAIKASLTREITDAAVGVAALCNIVSERMNSDFDVQDYEINAPSSIERNDGSIPNCNEMKSLSSNVGISPPGCVVEATELASKSLDVGWHDRILI